MSWVFLSVPLLSSSSFCHRCKLLPDKPPSNNCSVLWFLPVARFPLSRISFKFPQLFFTANLEGFVHAISLLQLLFYLIKIFENLQFSPPCKRCSVLMSLSVFTPGNGSLQLLLFKLFLCTVYNVIIKSTLLGLQYKNVILKKKFRIWPNYTKWFHIKV